MANFFSNLAHKKEQNFQENKDESVKEDWLDENYEGQLSVDVYSTNKEVIIKSTIAGVKPEDIDISVNNDMLTIRGERHAEKDEKIEEYFYQECYWGSFSRSIILPTEVDADKVSASFKNGILTIKLIKINKTKSVSIKVKEA